MPDGRSLLTLSEDNRWCLWDRGSGRPLTPRVLMYLPGAARGMFLTPDGSRLMLDGLDVLSLIDLSSVQANLGTIDEAKLLAELSSGRTIEGGSVVNLTSEQWLGRWREYGQLRPLWNSEP
jgi:hypothetical protein